MEGILGRKFLVPVLVIVAVAAAAMTKTEAQDLPCVAKLAGCADFYNNTSLTPSEECCGPLASELKTDVSCICAVFNNPALQKQFGIDVQTGMALVNRCNITGVDPNVCASVSPGIYAL
jgi:Probable lipid transfer